MTVRYARRTTQIDSSIVREVLKQCAQPDIISFAGGSPAPELFPVKQLAAAMEEVFRTDGRAAMAYSATDGYLPLRGKIASRMKGLGTSCSADDIMMLSGSQQGVDLAGKVFLEKGDLVVCENPTYPAALNAFRAYECEFLTIDTDDNGMIIEDLEQKLICHDRARLIYVVPTFQNPTGRTWSEKRRRAVLDIADRYGLPILEDDPYGELRYDGEKVSPIKALDTKGLVTYLGSFSKILCPGIRLGWVIAEPTTLQLYNTVKQGADLQAGTLVQMLTDKFLDENDLDSHIKTLQDAYRIRRDLMLEQLVKYFPKECQCDCPSGGLFLWVRMPEGFDTKRLLQQAIAERVAFVPGEAFFANGGPENRMRLNFSNADEEMIRAGMEKLGRIIHNNL